MPEERGLSTAASTQDNEDFALTDTDRNVIKNPSIVKVCDQMVDHNHIFLEIVLWITHGFLLR
jgi:hypothetical protein